MIWIMFLLLGLVFLGGGAAASYLHHTGRLVEMMPQVAPLLPLIKNLAISVGIGLSLLGIALAYRKLAQIKRVMSGRGASGRVRRARVPGSTRVRDKAVESDEEVSDDDSTRRLHRMKLGRE